MRRYKVAILPEAQRQLLDLYDYVAATSSPDVAAGFVDRIVTHCESLRTAPFRGQKRDDIRPGLRITNYRRQTVIAFAIEEDVVAIIGIFHGGRDWETALRTRPSRDE